MTDQADPAPTEDGESGIRALLAERDRALAARDAGALVASLAPDIVAFELAPPLAQTPAAARARAALQTWLDGWVEGPLVERRDLRIAVSGDLAWCHSLDRLSGTLKGGRRVDMWMRSTLGLRRTAGGWTIVHGHTSVPMRMDGSFRAATDLTPGAG